MLRTFLAAIVITIVIPISSLAEQIIIKPGETLSEIADRHKVSISILTQINGILDPNKLKAGDKIKLPSNSSLGFAKKEEFHTVNEGDTLGKIAYFYGSKESDIIELNNIKDVNYLRPGQTLKLPQKQSSASSMGKTFHRVAPGETLNIIAKNYNISPKYLVSINNLKNIDHLITGQVIHLSEDKLSKDLTIKNNTYHIVKPGQTLSNISEKYGIPLNDLIHINSINDPNKLISGEKISLKSKNHKGSSHAGIENEPMMNNSEWRNYGPLKINWAKWEEMDGSLVTPSFHKNGKAMYLAVNCPFRKLNATSNSGTWQDWVSPIDDFEYNLIKDICD